MPLRSAVGQRLGEPRLATRFLLGSLAILVAGMAVIGFWVARQIADGVVHRTAATTALYVDSLIAPPLQELAAEEWLSPAAADRLDWLLAETPLGRQVALFQVWDRDGHIVYASQPELVGQQLPVTGELAEAFAGSVSGDIGDPEAMDELPPGVPRAGLLEIYSPVRDAGSGQVIAAAEFYYAADDLNDEIAAAQRRSWLVVGGVAAVVYLLLAAFVRRASDTIAGQQRALVGQVTMLNELLRQNERLHARVRAAAAGSTAHNERVLRRVSAELHDGPAQDISLALLRLDRAQTLAAEANGDGGAAALGELERVGESLRHALQEVRATSAGLLLPHLGALTPAETIERAVRDHRRRTGADPVATLRDLPEAAPLATKIALYRIIQESLANAWRHAPGAEATVTVAGEEGRIRVEIADRGPGFDPAALGRDDAHLGLPGMRERVESLGGDFAIDAAPGRGTRIKATLPIEGSDE